MRKLFFGLGLMGLLTACGTSSVDVVISDSDDIDISKEEQIAEVTPNRVLKLDIDGMVCQMGCGGSIRKELNAAGGVGECNFDFEEGRDTNMATIEFDKELISADEITKLISEMNDGQFTVGESSANPIEVQDESSIEVETLSNSSEEETTVTMSSNTKFQLPNLLDIFSSLLTN